MPNHGPIVPVLSFPDKQSVPANPIHQVRLLLIHAIVLICRRTPSPTSQSLTRANKYMYGVLGQELKGVLETVGQPLETRIAGSLGRKLWAWSKGPGPGFNQAEKTHDFMQERRFTAIANSELDRTKRCREFPPTKRAPCQVCVVSGIYTNLGLRHNIQVDWKYEQKNTRADEFKKGKHTSSEVP